MERGGEANGFEDRHERGVVDAGEEREVQGVALALAVAHIRDIARAREEIAEFVEGHRHHAIRGVKGLLDAIAVVDIDIDVQNAGIHSMRNGDPPTPLQQLQDGQHDIVHVAEAGRLRLLGMMQTARPVDHNIGQTFVEATRTANGSRTVGSDVIKETVKNGAIFSDIDYTSMCK